MKKWRILRICAVLLLAGLLAGCGAPNVLGDERIKIGLSMATRDEFLTSMEEAAVKAAGDENVNLQVANANNDQKAQLSQIGEWAKEDYAAVIVVLCEDTAAQKVLEKAGTMPVVFLNRQPVDSALEGRSNVVYIGQKESDAGRMQGEYLAAYFLAQDNRTPRLAIIAGSAETHASAERVQAAKDALTAAGLRPRYIFETNAGWDRATAQKEFLAFLRDKPQVDGVLAANDEMAIGAADALAQAGYAVADIPIAGVDATVKGRAALRDGRIDFTAYQDPVAQGAGAIDAAVTLLGGGKPENMVDGVLWLDYTPITAANVDKFFPNDN